MEYDLFLKSFKYIQTNSKTPLENYCTEIFAYILKSLINRQDEIVMKILELFGIEIFEKDDLQKIEINTQIGDKINKGEQRIIPDIQIEYNNTKKILIEVKIDADLNVYWHTGESIDQLALYKKIPHTNIFSLTKHYIDTTSIEEDHKILWTQIYTIFSYSNDELILNFLNFLKEHGMKANAINKNIFDARENIFSLLELITQTWKSDKYKLEKKPDITEYWMGYYIKRNDERIGWIGQYYEFNDSLVLKFQNDKLKDKILKYSENNKEEAKYDVSGNIILSKLSLNDIINVKEEFKQREIIQKWIEQNIKIL
jgi:hypothetical protein